MRASPVQGGGKGGGKGGGGNPGKGEYYKNLYGGRGKGGGKGGGSGGGGGGFGGAGADAPNEAFAAPPPARLRRGTAEELRSTLQSMDGRPYPAYRDLENVEYDFGGRFSLVVQKVQSDPFAPP